MERLAPLIIGIAGGTGAGKTTIANAIINKIGEKKIAYLHQDSYYIDRSEVKSNERENINYDHPRALENKLLASHLRELKAGKIIEKPIYDFKTHTRKPNTETIYPKDIIILDGILIFVNKKIRDLINLKVFVDTDADIRLIRRIKRDTTQRGRTLESVINQYLKTVLPMHKKYVETSKQYADVIIRNDRYYTQAINKIIGIINSGVSPSL